MKELADFHLWRKLYDKMKNVSGKQLIGLPYSTEGNCSTEGCRNVADSRAFYDVRLNWTTVYDTGVLRMEVFAQLLESLFYSAMSA